MKVSVGNCDLPSLQTLNSTSCDEGIYILSFIYQNQRCKQHIPESACRVVANEVDGETLSEMEVPPSCDDTYRF